MARVSIRDMALNVATSRAKCLAVLVASPRLFELQFRSPRQIQLANALCRLREIAMITETLSCLGSGT